MKMEELVEQVSFLLDPIADEPVDGVDVRKAALIAFREIKEYIRTPVEKTVPYSTRIDLKKQDIKALAILAVIPSVPRIGLTLSSIDSVNVFQVAAAVNNYGSIGQTSSLNIDPIMSEMAMAQVRNTLSADFQWRHDSLNEVLYITHRDPRPAAVTIRYTPDFQDVSEIKGAVWQNFLVRLTEAYMKKALGRSRSKYRIEGSNVTLDGEALITEANAELEAIRQEMSTKKRKLIVVN